MRKLLLSLGSLGFVVVLLGASSSSAPFSDVSPNDPNAAAIQSLQEKSIINGYADGTFRSTALVNRAEFLKIILEATDFPVETALIKGSACFTDFTGAEQWYWGYACAGKQLNILTGHPDGTFRGTNTVNLAEALAMAVRAWNIPQPVYIRAPDHWYDPYMQATAGATKLFDFMPEEPSRKLTRGDAAAVIDAFLRRGNPLCDGHAIGESYKIDCNTCTCTEHGSACTKMYCGEQTSCYSSDQCGTGQVCTTEDGDCRRPPCPADEPNCIVPAVCMGVCRAK